VDEKSKERREGDKERQRNMMRFKMLIHSFIAGGVCHDEERDDHFVGDSSLRRIR